MSITPAPVTAAEGTATAAGPPPRATAGLTADPTQRPLGPPLLLDAAAARSCPVKTQYRFEPEGLDVQESASPPLVGTGRGRAPVDEQHDSARRVGDPRTVRAEVTRRRRAVLLESLIEHGEGRVVDLRLLTHGLTGQGADGQGVDRQGVDRQGVDRQGVAPQGIDRQRAATRAAMADGAEVIIGPALPADADGHRTGAPDVLVRGADTAHGPAYHPVVVSAHPVVEAVGPPAEEAEPASLNYPTLNYTTLNYTTLNYTTLRSPAPVNLRQRPGFTLRLPRRERDLRQLAHHHRTLQAAGWAGTRAWAGMLAPDRSDGQAVLAWTDLAEPALRSLDPAAPDGWRRVSVLERYDQAFARRLDIARAAVAQQPPMLEPVVIRECETCPWWQRCRDRLDPDDVGLWIDRGALDRREVERLRTLGAGTVTALAAADLDDLLPAYLPAVAHRSRPEPRLRTAQRRARMLLRGTDFARESAGPIEVPRAAVEVDLDLESAADDRTYLWGFWVERPAQPGSGRYVSFGRFADLDDAAETTLAVRALGWLRRLVEAEPSVAVYHYSGYEVGRIQALATRVEHPALRWAADYADAHFVDLLEIVQQHYFGVHGLGLKLIATYAGFAWRDEDPGGLNSQGWFADAAHAPEEQTRTAARQRVLDYNEDDVRATRHLRRWLASR